MEEGFSNIQNMDDLKLSKYNSAFAILYRIDRLWQDSHIHSRNGLYEKWNLDLDRIWCEIAADANEEFEKQFEALNTEIKLIGFKRTNEGTIILAHKLYPILMKKEIFLRRLQNKQGKGVAYEDSIDDYME